MRSDLKGQEGHGHADAAPVEVMVDRGAPTSGPVKHQAPGDVPKKPEDRPRWRSRPALHAAALLFALALFVALGGPFTSISSDEGAGIHQAVLLQRGGWLVAPTLPELDPDLLRQPFLRADAGPKGRAPYAKHPAYPLLLEKAGQAWWPGGLLVPGVLGTWVAALAAAALAGALRRRAAVPTLWLVGLGSPLAVDAQMVLAHAPAAGTAAVAALAAAIVLAPDAFGRLARSWVPLAATLTAGIAAAATVALRTEGLLLVAGLVLGALVAGSSWRRALPLAAALGAGALAARVVEVATTRSIVGAGSGAPGSPAAGTDLVSGRIQAVRSSWIDVAFEQHLGRALLAVGVAALVLAVIGARCRARPAIVIGLLATAAGGTAMWLALGEIGLVPGLLPATPWLAAGLASMGTSALRRGLPRFLATASASAAAAVLATQYSYGGGIEWGGRFYAVVLPVAAPLVVVALWRGTPTERVLTSGAQGHQKWALAGRRPSSPIVLAVVAVTALVSVGGLIAVRNGHRNTATLADAVATAARTAPPGRPGDPDRRAVVVSNMRLWPQLLWPQVDDRRWVTADEARLPCALHGLHTAGFTRLVLAGPAPRELVALAEAQGWRLAADGPTRGFSRVVEATPGRPAAAPVCPPGLGA